MSRWYRHLSTLILVANAGCASARPVKPADPASVVPARFDAFYLPGAKFMCRPIQLPPTAPPSFIGFEFEDGDLMINDRLINAAYDSQGGPRLLIVNASQKTDEGPPAKHLFSVSFPDDRPPLGFELVVPPGVDETTVPQNALTPAMTAKARELLIWLWNHRCARSPSG